MTYFEDLTPYQFLGLEENTLNVGWLSSGHDFPTGEVSNQVLTVLEVLAGSAENLTRGFHECEICAAEKHGQDTLRQRGHVESRPACGNGKIRVTTRDGLTYAAPVLIIHYIKEHDYLPPLEFLQAVSNLSGPNTA